MGDALSVLSLCTVKIHMPPQHHVKSAQRLADGALVFFCIIMALTGLVLWLNTGLLP